MLITLVKIFGLASIGVLWIHSEPTITLREWLFGARDRWWIRLLECCLCSSFWLGLFATGFNLYLAAIISVVAELISQKLNSRL